MFPPFQWSMRRENRGVKQRIVLTVLLACVATTATGQAIELMPATLAGFSRYVTLTEARIEGELRSDSFLWIDTLPAARRHEVTGRLRRGEPIIEGRETLDAGGPIVIPGALIQHWFGIIFIPGVSLRQTLATVQDYRRYPRILKDVSRADVVEQLDDEFRVVMRVARKPLAFAFELETDTHYQSMDAAHVYSRSYATRIVDLKDYDRPQEQQRPSAFLWRLNRYARFEERDGGTYMQLESIALSRGVPPTLVWVLPVVRQLVKAELADVLKGFRSALLRRP
jgi:hypothetical protein